MTRESVIQIMFQSTWQQPASKETPQKPAQRHIVYRGISPSPQPPIFFAKPPLNLQTVQVTPFLGNCPLYISFSWTPPKSRVFQWTPKIFKFFILNLILLSCFLKLTKLLVKISQFEFLVMTEKSYPSHF